MAYFSAMNAVRGMLVALALGALVIATAEARERAFAHHAQTQRYQDRYYLPPPNILRLASLGHREALADLVWIAALNNFGRELIHRGGARYVFQYADAALALDPDFRRVYLWIGTTSMYRATAPTLQAAERAAKYLVRAAERFPDDGEIMWQAAAHFSYEMPPLTDNPEAAAEYKRRGLPYLEAAALLGGGPPWLGLVAASNMARLGEQERAIHHLTQLYLSAPDADTKAQIRERLGQLRSANFADALAHAEAQWRARKTAEFPYLDDTLYLLVGPRPPFDGAGQLVRRFDPLAVDVPAADAPAPE